MNNKLRPSTLILLLLISCSAQSQKEKSKTREIDVSGFRTEGGLANIVEGSASFLHPGLAAERLRPLQEFANGDTIEVGDDGRVEVLLNPSMYLRLSPKAQLTFLDLSPDNLKLRVSNGAAILEILEMPNDQKSPSANELRGQFSAAYQAITVSTPVGDFVPTRGGIYRCDVETHGHFRLRVFKGFVAVAGTLLGRGMETPLRARVPSVTKFDLNDLDSFDQWSRARAIALVAANKSLRNTDWHTQLRKEPHSYLSIVYDEASKRMKERLTVSALGGVIGYAESGARYQSNDQSWQPLSEGVDLQNGDRVKTSPDSRVEIRLFPSCYLTMSNDTEIVYDAGGDGGAAVKLLKGSVIVASSLKRKEGITVVLSAPEANIEITNYGFYRLNVKPGRESEMLVYEGSIRMKSGEVTENHRIVFAGQDYDISPIRHRDMDTFELWTRKRSAMLFESTKDSGRQIGGPNRNVHRVANSGMWYLDKSTGAYTFVPGANEFSSPYGGRYSVGFEGRFHR